VTSAVMTQREPAQTWTIGKVLEWATADFRARGLPNPRLDAEVLLAFALGETRIKLVIDRDRPLAAEDLARFRELVKRRRAHEPVAYLVGVREFYGRAFRVDARVLVPRPDTEALVDAALQRTAHVSMSLRALDLCTGSGCVAVTIARERPTSRVHATDTSEGALTVARENALRIGAYNASFARADLFEGLDPLRLRVDLVVANPPYIATAEIADLAPDIRDHEPRAAIDGGMDGLDLIRRIVDGAPAFLVAGGALALEVAAGQAPEVARLMSARGFQNVAATRDYAGIERVVAGKSAG
jgi:release factor glutamine methyltransferase